MVNNMRNAIRIVLLFSGLFFLGSTTGALAESVWDKEIDASAEPAEITVYRSPTCGCCGKWLEHMKKHGFEVRDVVTENMEAVKQKLGVPKRLGSCHTAVVGDYVIEGHVPAGDIKALLKDKPNVAGLSVPAMPIGTPGMEMGGTKQPFDVLSFDKEGNARKFHEYPFY